MGSLRYGLHWPGKQAARAEAQAPLATRWVPCPAESRGQGPHRFVEGDNLEALKHLLAAHPAAFQAIYIDPPYNTGADMRYADNFTMAPKDYRAIAAPDDEAGRRHAAWLSMMLPRLSLARELLREDGVLFASIDDHEVHHLRLLLDETFGAENFVATIVWRKKVVRGRGARHVLPQTEYVHVYAKQLAKLPRFSEPLTDAMREEYAHADEHGPYKLIPLAKSGTAHSPRPNLHYPIPAPDGSEIPCPTHQWRWSRETLEARRSEVVFKQQRSGKWAVYTKQRLVVDGAERERTPLSYYDRATTTDGTRELKGLFGRVVIDFPKPVRLLRDLLSWATAPDAWVLDFFAGSCPTAQAVLELNAEDGGSRRFVCVQRPEATGESEFPTIAEIGKERIRRVMGRLDPAGSALGFEVVKLVPAEAGVPAGD